MGFLLLAAFLIMAPSFKPQEVRSVEKLPTNTYPITGVRNEGFSALADTLFPVSNTPIRFRHISEEEGLANTVIHSIIQDHQGFIWIGTAKGLNRYDGQTFKVFLNDPQDPNSISSDTIWHIYEDQQKNLWIGTSNGLNKFDRNTGQFHLYAHDPTDSNSLSNNIVKKIYEDKSGNLWIATDGGLNLFDRQTDTFKRFRHQINNAHSLSNDFINDIYEDSSGALWIATRNGLNRFDQVNEFFITYKHDPNDFTSIPDSYTLTITEDSQGVLWIGTLNGSLVKYNRKRETFQTFKLPAPSSHATGSQAIWHIYRDNEDFLWISTGNGLYRLDTQTQEYAHYSYLVNNPTSPESLSNATVSLVFRDRSGVYWAGTIGGGLNLFYNINSHFFHFTHNAESNISLDDDTVLSVYEDNKNNLWVGTSTGLNRFNPSDGSYKHYQHDPDNSHTPSGSLINVIYKDNANNFWLGTEKGLSLYQPLNDYFGPYKVRYIGANNPDALNNTVIRSITQDKSGLIWIGTEGELGLVKYDPMLKQAVSVHPEYFANKIVTAIYRDRNDILWIGTMLNGLCRLDTLTGQITHYTYDPQKTSSLSNNSVLSIYQDSSGIHWFGTMDGLNRLNLTTHTFRHYHETDGLPTGIIHNIQGDEQGRLWLSTNRSISVFNPENNTFKEYDYQNGLHNSDFNTGASFSGPSGYIYFGGRNGLTAFQPVNFKQNTYIPPIMLTAFKQYGEDVVPNTTLPSVKEIILKWPQNHFEFEFAALSYIEPEKNQYAYRLENYEEQWHFVRNINTAHYTNLPGGRYTLHIIGSNNDGIWNEEGYLLHINVIPPIWQNTWFQIAIIIAVIFMFFGGYRLRLRQAQTHNRELAIQVKQRTREIEQRRQVAEGLREILLRLNSNQPLEKSLNFIVRQINHLIDIERVCLFENIKDNHRVVVSSYRSSTGEMRFTNFQDIPIHFPENILKWFSQLSLRSEIKTINNLQDIILFRPQTKTPAFDNIHSLVVLPISPGGNNYGGLAFMYQTKKDFSNEELDLLMSFADQASLAVGNAQLRIRSEELAAVTERSRLARDLHDAVTQTLFSASLIAEALPPLWKNDQQEGQQLLKELRQLNRGALAEMRTLLLELRPAAIIDTKFHDLLQQLAEAITGRTTIKVDLDTRKDCVFPEEVHITLYRIAQEALNNIVKHANANYVYLGLYLESSMNEKTTAIENNETYVLEIYDDGAGFDINQTPQGRFGLTNIRERAQAIGAKLEISSKIGEGTQIRIKWSKKANHES